MSSPPPIIDSLGRLVGGSATIPRMKPRHTHPAVFMFLILPFGVMGGYLAVAVAYLLSKAGVPIEQTAALIAIGLLPHTWKFAWAPIADTTLSRKSWYLLASVVSAAGIWATGIFPANCEQPADSLGRRPRLQHRRDLPRDGGREPDGLRHAGE